MDYWKECVECALEDAGVAATKEQIEQIIEAVRAGFDCYGMAYPAPSSPLISGIDDLQRELKSEQDKVHCRECGGWGSIHSQGPHHGSTSRCWKCNGKGRVDP